MKRILCAIMAMLMLLTVCGCGDRTTGTGDEADTKVEFTAGEWNGSVYTNEFAGITFNLPDGWSRYNDEDLAEMMQISLDIVADNNAFAQKIAELSTVYGMIANDQSGNSIQVVFENLLVTGNKDMTTTEYLDTVLPMLEATYTEYGFTCNVQDVTTVMIGETEYEYALISVEYMGVVIEQGYACQKFDNYICSIALTAYQTGGCETLLSCFA